MHPVDSTLPMRLFVKGVDVPKSVLGAARNINEAVYEKGEEAEPKNYEIVEKYLDSYFGKLMTPGPEYAPDSAPADWKPNGQCDGVIYLGGIRNPAYDRKDEASLTDFNQIFLKPSLMKKALRYLKPANPLICIKKNCPDGMARIKWQNLCAHCPGIGLFRADIQKTETESEQPVQAYFSLNQAAIDAVQPAHANRWVCRKAEEGIWCIFYI